MPLNSPTVSFLAIIPLAKVCIPSVAFISTLTNRVLLAPQLFAYATDELSIRVGETLAGLLNATLVRPSFSPSRSIGSLLFVGKHVSFSANLDCACDLIASAPCLFFKHPHRVELIVAVRKTCCVPVHRLTLSPRSSPS
jgi:hypothetical protein